MTSLIKISPARQNPIRPIPITLELNNFLTVLTLPLSAAIESFSDGETLEFPQYTKPSDFNGMKVPDVLLSGNHAEIAKWRAANSLKAE